MLGGSILLDLRQEASVDVAQLRLPLKREVERGKSQDIFVMLVFFNELVSLLIDLVPLQREYVGSEGLNISVPSLKYRLVLKENKNGDAQDERGHDLCGIRIASVFETYQGRIGCH